MKVGDLVKIVGHIATGWQGCHGIIVGIHNHRGHKRHCIVLTSGDKKWFDLDELELLWK